MTQARLDAHLRTATLSHVWSLARVGCVRLTRVGGGGVGGGDAAAAAFCPASYDELVAAVDPARGGAGDVGVAPLTPGFVLSRSYLRFRTLALFPDLRELRLLEWPWRG